jgi:hypothetical protein
MAHQESPLVKRLTFRLPVALYLSSLTVARRRRMELGELIRFLLNEEMLRSPLTKEEADAIEKKVQRIADGY